MKRFKKMMAIAVVAVMTLMYAVPMSVFADFGFDSEVSVEGLTAGDTVKYYQVLDWDQTNGTWKLATGFTSLTSDTAFNTTDGATSVVADIVDGITQAQAEKIAACVNAETGAPSVKYTDPAITGTTSKYTLPSGTAAMGLYMAIVTAGTPQTVYNPAFMGADFETTNTTNKVSITAHYEGTSIAKKQTITVSKTTEDSDSTIAQAIDSYVGQEVTFHVDTTIPVFLDSYTKPSFVIDDAIKTDGIEFVPNSVKVTLGSTEYVHSTVNNGGNYYDSGAFTDFTVTEKADQKGYTVEFAKDYLKGLTTAVPVKIVYKGKITSEANFNVNEDDNEVTVTYSNGPGEEKAALKDRTNHYTFSIGGDIFGADQDEGTTYELVKVGVDKNGKPVISKSEVGSWKTKTERHPLAGATFKLYTDEACTQPYTNDLYNGDATCTTGADGIINFKGLAAGTYYIQEETAPDGYVKDSRKVKVTIKAYYKNVEVPETVEKGIKIAPYQVEVLDYYTVSVDNVSTYNSNGTIYSSSSTTVVNTFRMENNGAPSISSIAASSELADGDVLNTKGVELPSTGGIGTTMFYIIGAILIIGAGVLLVTRRRTESVE